MISKKKKQWLIAAVISGVALSSFMENAYAEEFDDEEETAEIVVSATRTEMEVKEAPSTITVINRREIEERKANNMIDVLRDVTGVFVKPVGAMSMDDPIRIRGSKGNHVLILIDGKRINGEASASNARELERIRLDNVERIEVMKGSASSLYGSDAIGGVINIITRSPEKTQLEIYTSYRSLEGEGSVKNNLGFYFESKKQGSFAWNLSAGRNHINPLSLTPNTTEYVHGNEIPVKFKGVWDVKKDQKITFELGYLKEDLDMKDKTNRTEYDNERWDYSLEYAGKTGKNDWQVRYYGSEYEKNYTTYRKTTGIKSGNDYAKNTSNVLEGKLSRPFDDKNLITAGFELKKQKLEGSRLKNGEQESNQYAFYLQDEWTPSKKWLLIPSVRVEKEESFDTSVTPKLGVTFSIRPDMRLKANASAGYRSPSLAERHNDWIMAYMGPITIRQVGNPDLDSEKSIALEFGFEKDWKNHNFQIRMYRSEVKDLIDSYMTRITPFRWVASYRNIDEAVLQGIELSSQHKLTKELNFRLGYNYLDSYDQDTDDRLYGRAKHQFTVGLTFNPTKSLWSFSVDGNYLADYLYDNGLNGQNKSFLIANGMINRKFGKSQNGTAYVGVENFLDKKDTEMHYYGRTYVLGVNYKF